MALGSNRNEYQESSWGVKGGRFVRLTFSPPSVSRLSRENVGASTSHNPMGLQGLLQGQIYLTFTCTYTCSECFKIPTAQSTSFWYLTPFGLVEVYLRSTGMSCLHRIASPASRQTACLASSSILNIQVVHSAETSVNFYTASQKTVLFIVIVRTSNPT
jgi:hypothetical protein